MAFDEKQIIDATEAAQDGAEARQQTRDYAAQLKLAKAMMVLSIILGVVFIAEFFAKIVLHKDSGSLWSIGILAVVSILSSWAQYRAAKRPLQAN